jgi:hypothetical protein
VTVSEIYLFADEMADEILHLSTLSDGCKPDILMRSYIRESISIVTWFSLTFLIIRPPH